MSHIKRIYCIYTNPNNNKNQAADIIVKNETRYTIVPISLDLLPACILNKNCGSNVIKTQINNHGSIYRETQLTLIFLPPSYKLNVLL